MRAAARATGRPPPTRLSRGSIREFVTDGPGFLWLMLAPSLLVLAIVVGVPIGKAILLSFDRVVLTRPALAGHFTLHNYLRLVTDPNVGYVVLRTCVYMVGTVVGSVVVGLSAALLTRGAMPLRGLFRSVFILPWTLPAIVAAMVWGVMYDANFGILNRLVQYLPFVDGNVEWLLDRRTVLPSLIAVQVWNEFPVAYLFFLAALYAIPRDLYEAASVDGASQFRQFVHVTLPQIRHVTAVIVVLLLIFGFRAFPVIFLLTGGREETLTVATYNAAFRAFDFSYAATLGVLSMLVSLVLVLLYMRVSALGGRADAP